MGADDLERLAAEPDGDRGADVLAGNQRGGGDPGLVPAVKYLDAIIIMAYYRAIGKIEKADVLAGLGIVACAVVIILARSFA